MAEYETALVMGKKRKQIEVLGLLVCAKVKDKMKLERLNLVSYSHNLD
jgi:hypothetical protein